MTYLYNAARKVIGRVEDFPTGPKIYDGSGRMLGWYDTSVDRTFNDSGVVVGSGNLLTMLLRS
jgi:hypothetical protein